jgi:hypothetical protein
MLWITADICYESLSVYAMDHYRSILWNIARGLLLHIISHYVVILQGVADVMLWIYV